MGYDIKTYEARDGWRWRMVASNSRIVAESGESYATLRNVERAVAKLEENIGLARVDREQFIVIRREHWDSAKNRLQTLFHSGDSTPENLKRIDEFIDLVETSAV